MPERESGWYFVKYNGNWMIASYNPAFDTLPWLITDSEVWLQDRDFEEIGERIKMPDEE
jgi:hypothetical protein